MQPSGCSSLCAGCPGFVLSSEPATLCLLDCAGCLVQVWQRQQQGLANIWTQQQQQQQVGMM